MSSHHDAEKGVDGHDSGSPGPDYTQMSSVREPWNRRFIDSFKRDPNAQVTKPAQAVDAVEGRAFDHKAAAERTANSGLAHKLKARHMQMIAIGGSIGESRAEITLWRP